MYFTTIYHIKQPKNVSRRFRLSPPREVHTKQPLRFVSYFYLWDCFGIVVNFERPKIENVSHLNWISQQRDEHGQWSKKKSD